MKRFLIFCLLIGLAAPSHAQRIITKGATDQSVYIKIIDSADGTPETGVVFNTSGIDIEYVRAGAAATDITEATQTAGGAHSDGGFVHVGHGVYRLDLPDAAVASGVDSVVVQGTVTDMIVIGTTIQLTALPLQTATVDLGAISGSSTAANNAEIVFDTDFATNYDATVDGWNVDVEFIGGTDEATALIDATDVNAEVDTALADYDPPTRAELTSDIGTVTSAIGTAQADLDIITGASGVVIADGTLTSGKFSTTALSTQTAMGAANSITASILAANCITASEIQDAAIDAASFAANAIDDTVLADNAITANKIAADAIGASELATNAIGAAEIATDAIGAAEIAASAIANGTEATGFGTAQTGDSFARLGAPVGASISADLQIIDGNVDDTETQTTATSIRAAVGLASANLDTQFGTTLKEDVAYTLESTSGTFDVTPVLEFTTP